MCRGWQAGAAVLRPCNKRSKAKFLKKQVRIGGGAGGLTACQKVANLAQLTSAANLNGLRMSSECRRGGGGTYLETLQMELEKIAPGLFERIPLVLFIEPG